MRSAQREAFRGTKTFALIGHVEDQLADVGVLPVVRDAPETTAWAECTGSTAAIMQIAVAIRLNSRGL